MECGVVGVGTEVPRVVVAGGAVDVDVPGGVDAGVVGGLLQFGGGLSGTGRARGLAGCLGVLVSGGGGAVALP